MSIVDIDRAKRNLHQSLKPGTSVDVWLTTEGTKHDLSIVPKPTDGADVAAVIDVRSSAGGSAPYGAVSPYFVIVGYDPTGKVKTSTIGTALPTRGDTALFKGPVNAVKGLSARLRLRVDVAPDAPADLVLETVQFSGWYEE